MKPEKQTQDTKRLVEILKSGEGDMQDKIREFLDTNPSINWNYKDEGINPVLHIAVENGDEDTIKMLLGENPPIEIRYIQNSRRDNAGDLALMNQKFTIADVLKKYKPLEKIKIALLLVGSGMSDEIIDDKTKNLVTLIDVGTKPKYDAGLQKLKGYKNTDTALVEILAHGDEDGNVSISGDVNIKNLILDIETNLNPCVNGLIDVNCCHVSKDVLAKNPGNNKQYELMRILNNDWILCLSGAKTQLLGYLAEKSIKQALVGVDSCRQDISIFQILAEKTFLSQTFKVFLKFGDKKICEKFNSLKKPEECLPKTLGNKELFLNEYRDHILKQIGRLEEIFLDKYSNDKRQQNKIISEANNVREYLGQNLEKIVSEYVDDNFLRAISDEKEERVKFYLENANILKGFVGLDIIHKQRDSSLILSGNVKIFNLLKSSGIDDDCPSLYLCVACKDGYQEIVKILLEDKSVDLKWKDGDDYSALHYVIYGDKNTSEVLKVLLDTKTRSKDCIKTFFDMIETVDDFHSSLPTFAEKSSDDGHKRIKIITEYFDLFPNKQIFLDCFEARFRNKTVSPYLVQLKVDLANIIDKKNKAQQQNNIPSNDLRTRSVVADGMKKCNPCNIL